MVPITIEPLPPLSRVTPVSYFWFPTPAQCFIYRNWEMLTPNRIAQVLNAPVSTVLTMAKDMGLGEPASEELQTKWLRVGYATLIRANWQILPYEQLLTLLGWDAEKLAFTLQHDDFLGVKLGQAKPDAPVLRVESLTKDAQKKTAKIAAITQQLRKKLGARTAEPFSFADFFPTVEELQLSTGESNHKTLCLSYCSLYGYVFDEEYMEYSFPDALLEAYAAMGFTGFIAQAVLYSLVPFTYAPELAEGCEQRLQGIRALIKRLARYGLKLYLYLNEPRDLPDSCFENRMDLKGDVIEPGRASICLSVPQVQDAFRKSIYDLTMALPGLGGYHMVTASENHTNCYSHRENGETTCPRCKNKTRAELFSLVIQLVKEGAHAADPTLDISASAWAWDAVSSEPREKCIADVCARLPKDTYVWGVAEHLAEKQIGEVLCEVRDYSISVPGPSEYAKDLFRTVRNNGLRPFAKLQLNNSWEFSSVPYIPVFHMFYNNIRSLIEQVGPDMVQLNWTQGGYPSPVLRMYSEMNRKGEPIPSEDALLQKFFPTADFSVLKAAFACFDKGFDAYPFSVATMYAGPQHMGPALPLFPKNTGFRACMCGPSYDDLNTWRLPFSEDTYEHQFVLMANSFEKGLSLLKKAFSVVDRDSQLLLDCAEVACLHFASTVNHVRYVRERETGKDLTDLIRQEEKLAIREAEIMLRNPMIGFEATNHYYYTVTDLCEKILNCKALLGEL